jgi:hypothetical protein
MVEFNNNLKLWTTEIDGEILVLKANNEIDAINEAGALLIELDNPSLSHCDCCGYSHSTCKC